MSKSRKTTKTIENAHTDDPINPGTDNPSLNSEIHAHTAINSSVKPEDYPIEKREDQVRAATGKGP